MEEKQKKTLGIFGLGGFGQLMAKNLQPHFDLKACDPSPEVVPFAKEKGIPLVTPQDLAACEIVVIGTPIPKMEETIHLIAPHVKPGTLVLDVGSVKVKPALWMKLGLPEHVDVIATHPLFGPQSAAHAIKGQIIAVCPVRGDRTESVIAFLRDTLELEVKLTTPEEHDYEVAHIQGLTHMIGRIMTEMEPLPHTMTTKSFDVLMDSVNIVRGNSLELFLSIERENPFAADVHKKFFRKVEELRQFLRSHDAWDAKG
jgi:prephenate dehydrogenase